jgi:hypothetical protein
MFADEPEGRIRHILHGSKEQAPFPEDYISNGYQFQVFLFNGAKLEDLHNILNF